MGALGLALGEVSGETTLLLSGVNDWIAFNLPGQAAKGFIGKRIIAKSH
jgi:hypothetical protein